MSAVLKLNRETLDQLETLVSINVDSATGFRTAADRVRNPASAGLFRGVADARDANVAQLRPLIDANGGSPDPGGTWKGALHRWWLEARGALSGGDDRVVLIEAERGEDAIRHSYELAVRRTAAAPVAPLINEQYAQVRAQRDRIRAARDARIG